MKKIQLSITITPDMYRRVLEDAQTENRDTSNMIDTILKHHYGTRRKK